MFAIGLDVGGGDELDQLSGLEKLDVGRAAIADADEGETNFFARSDRGNRTGFRARCGGFAASRLATGPQDGRSQGTLF